MKSDTGTQNKSEIVKKPLCWRFKLAAVVLIICVIAFVFFKSLHQLSPEPYPIDEQLNKSIFRKSAARMLEKEPEDLTEDDFANLKELVISNSGFSDLTLLSKTPNLQLLSLESVTTNNLKPLAELKNLQTLDLDYVKTPKTKTPKWMVLLDKIGIMDLSLRKMIDISV